VAALVTKHEYRFSHYRESALTLSKISRDSLS
jgi:hypothetical protein